MKSLIVMIAFISCAISSASGEEHTGSLLGFRPAAAMHFGKADAQVLADARRVAVYGVCGMSVFKEKKGPVWIFETNVGYAGLRKPDISIVEPPMTLPSFEVRIELPIQPPQRNAGSRPSSVDPSESETAFSLGPRG